MIEFTTGEVVTKGQGTLAINAFYRKSAIVRESPIHLAEHDSQSGLRKGSDNIVETVPSGNPRLQKYWTTRRLDTPNGSVIKFVIRKHTPGVGFGASMCVIAIKSLDTAPLQRIEIDLPFTDGCTKSRIYIEGRFDRLTPERYEELGLHKTGSRDDANQIEVAEEALYIHTKVLEKALAPANQTKVTKLAGGKVLTKIKRTRRVGLVD